MMQEENGNGGSELYAWPPDHERDNETHEENELCNRSSREMIAVVMFGASEVIVIVVIVAVIVFMMSRKK